VSGEARAGELLGVLGPSGSGKSSLLALLASQKALLPPGCASSGSVTVGYDGVDTGSEGAGDASSQQRVATVGFVQQHDCLMPTLTVAESVLLAIMLRKKVVGRAVEDASALVAALLRELAITGAPRRPPRPDPAVFRDCPPAVPVHLPRLSSSKFRRI
jgi:putative ABC transport system ATP-binding protein